MGVPDGPKVCAAGGAPLGGDGANDTLGARDTLGIWEMVGAAVPGTLGANEIVCLAVGSSVTSCVGSNVGLSVGTIVGRDVGDPVVGLIVGVPVGLGGRYLVGLGVGLLVIITGDCVGLLVIITGFAPLGLLVAGGGKMHP
jgi:hypothetical protein